MPIAPITSSSVDSTGLILTIIWSVEEGTWGKLTNNAGTLVASQNGRAVLEASNDGGSAGNYDPTVVFTMLSPLYANQPITLAGLPEGYITDDTIMTAAVNGDGLMINESGVSPPMPLILRLLLLGVI